MESYKKSWLIRAALTMLIGAPVWAQSGSDLSEYRLSGNMNSAAVEYAPSISADGQTLVFQSNRRGKYEIFIANKNPNGQWSEPRPIEPINSHGTAQDLIGGPTLSFDGNSIYFFASFDGGVGIEDIYYSVREGNTWSKPKNAGRGINSRGYEGFPSISSDGKSVYFVRRATKPSDPSKFCTQIMVSDRNPDGTWSTAEALPVQINTGCEKYPRILSDNETLIFSRFTAGSSTGFDIFQTRKSEDGSWSQPVAIEYLNTSDDDLFASVPSSGDLVYFNNKLTGNFDLYAAPLRPEYRPKHVIDVQGVVSDRELNPLEASFDIIRGGKSQNNRGLLSNKSDGTFTMVLVEGYSYTVVVRAEGYEPKELPFDLTQIRSYELIRQNIQLERIRRVIHMEVRHKERKTPLDVSFLSIDRPDFNLQSDSTGHYTLPMNYGDKLDFTIQKNGYASVDMALELNTQTMDSLRYVVYLNPGVPKLTIQVIDNETQKPLNATLDFSKGRGQSVFRGSMVQGKYESDLEHNRDYQIKIRMRGYFSHQDTIHLRGIFDGRQIMRNVELIPLKPGNKLTLNSINFEVNSAQLSEGSKEILDEVAYLLRQNRTLVVEVGAHSDDLGEEAYNLSLSEKRAQSVKEYLMTKGVSERALRVKGYGESTPMVPNDSDEGRARNRRVEFIILRG